MPPRWKAETDGPSVFMSFHLRDIRLCHSSWPSPSRRRDVPETDDPETDGVETDVPETDDPETDGVETDGFETDGPETEESRDGGRPRWMFPSLKVCF